MKITIKLERAADAYEALVKLSREKLAYRTAHAMMLLKKELHKEAEFLQDEELKIAKEHAVLDEEGKIKWVGAGKFQIREGMQKQYRKAMQELLETEVSIEQMKAAIPPENITLEQMEALDGLLIFEEG